VWQVQYTKKNRLAKEKKKKKTEGKRRDNKREERDVLTQLPQHNMKPNYTT